MSVRVCYRCQCVFAAHEPGRHVCYSCTESVAHVEAANAAAIENAITTPQDRAEVFLWRLTTLADEWLAVSSQQSHYTDTRARMKAIRECEKQLREILKTFQV